MKTSVTVEMFGNLGKDPAIEYKPNSIICKFSVAHNYKDFQGKDVTEWYTVTTWGKTAEACNQYLHKGSSVYIRGELTCNIWTDRTNNAQIGRYINAQEVKFLDKKSDNQDRDPFADDSEPSDFD